MTERKLTMTVHQRLAAQRRAVRTEAAWRAHRREVSWFGSEGDRCGSCWDIPLKPWEHPDQEQEELNRETVAFMRQFGATWAGPEPQDPKRLHIAWALGYLL
jgi:hypothetical protein